MKEFFHQININFPFSVILDFCPLFVVKKLGINCSAENIKKDRFIHINVFAPRFFPQKNLLRVGERYVCELIDFMDEREVNPEIDKRITAL